MIPPNDDRDRLCDDADRTVTILDNDNVTATWSISLDAECPHCKQTVDLLDYSDFWDGRKFFACENGTARSRNVEVTCPDCAEYFVVDFEY